MSYCRNGNSLRWQCFANFPKFARQRSDKNRKSRTAVMKNVYSQISQTTEKS